MTFRLRSARARRAGGTLLVATVAAALAGCASTLPPLAELIDRRGPARVELTGVPFFPQADYQCGPAALATVLHTVERPVTPDEVVPQVYLPGRRGTLQLELVAAARAHDRLPYRVAPALADAVAQTEAGRPVLVMQNLGLRILPVWHFAVLVGYDATANTVVLRSGRTERRVMKAARFDRTWARAERWGVVALPPGELPARPDLDRYLSAAAALEAIGKVDAARASYEAARDQWPDSAWPWLGLANLRHAGGDLAGAEEAYVEAVRRDPSNVAARHNLAETLAARGCIERARVEIAAARESARGTPLQSQVDAAAMRLAAVSAPLSAAACRTASEGP